MQTKISKDADDDTAIHIGSGNVFADLGLPNPEQRQIKARLMYAISNAIKRNKLTQAQAAKKVGLTQPDISCIVRGRGAGYSTDRLIEVLRHLGQDVSIVLTPANAPVGKLEVTWQTVGGIPRKPVHRTRTVADG
jgi:predicted XRE-type DNA-binding protein